MKLDKHLMTLMKKNIKNNITTMLAGPPGIGKSSICEQVTEEMGAHYVLLPCNHLADRGDVTGSRTLEYTRADGSTGFKQHFFPHQKIVEAVEYALAHPDEIVVLVLGEITRAKPEVTSAVLSMETERVVGHMELPPNLSMIVDGNLKGNIEALDTASTSRFAIYQVMPDAVTYMEYMGDTLHPLIREVLQEDPDLIYIDPADHVQNTGELDALDEDSTRQITTPRTISSMNRLLHSLSDDEMTVMVNEVGTPLNPNSEAEISLMYEIIMGHTGDTEFSKNLQRKVRIYVDSLTNVPTGSAPYNAVSAATTPVANALTTMLDDQVFGPSASTSGTATFQHAETIIRRWANDPDTLAETMLYYIYSGDIPATSPHIVQLLADTLQSAGTPATFFPQAMRLIQEDMVSPNSTDMFFNSSSPNPVLSRLATMHGMLGSLSGNSAGTSQ